MIVYIFRKIKKIKKISYTNNIINKVMNKQTNDEKQREKYINFYDFSKKHFFYNIKKLYYSKKDM